MCPSLCPICLCTSLSCMHVCVCMHLVYVYVSFMSASVSLPYVYISHVFVSLTCVCVTVHMFVWLCACTFHSLCHVHVCVCTTVGACILQARMVMRNGKSVKTQQKIRHQVMHGLLLLLPPQQRSVQYISTACYLYSYTAHSCVQLHSTFSQTKSQIEEESRERNTDSSHAPP